MLEKFDSYWSVVNGIMCIAAILDPMYKMKIIEFSYQKVYGRRGSEEIEKIKKIFYDLLAEYGSENTDKEASCSQPPSSMKSVSHDFVQNWLRKFDYFVSNITNNRNKKCENVVGEFDTYIKEGLLQRSEIYVSKPDSFRLIAIFNICIKLSYNTLTFFVSVISNTTNERIKFP